MQPNASSVQQTINEAISKILRSDINIVGAGRTDAGVHATQMIAHFDSKTELDPYEITNKLNAFLPEDIVIHTIFLTEDEAHARFDAISRSYEYRIWLGRNPFLIDTTWQLYQQRLDIEKMNEAAQVLLDYTNFKCFSKSKTDVRTYDCKVFNAEWKLKDNSLIFHISADRFLRNMVRAIVGTLVDIGLAKKTRQDLINIIKSKDRTKAGFSVPAQGLFLTNVTYKKEVFKNR